MFPTISSLLEYLLGITVSLQIPTFGFFVALAFILSYITFLSEFKRKENEGVITSFEKEVEIGRGASLADYFEFGFLGFLLGFKVLGAIIYYNQFFRSPLRFIFSLQGSWLFAFLGSISFCMLIFWHKKQEKLTIPIKKKVILHPYQLMPK
ncbi:MAG: diacylglyceryl transferase, partial [Flavobacterium sp.]